MRWFGVRSLASIAWLAVLGCQSQGPAALLISLESELQVPQETNSLVVRVLDQRTPLTEQTYSLGDAPRDRWPQTLPLLAGQAHSKTVMLATELRIATVGQPSVVVGFQETQLTFPERGQDNVSITIPRSCVDEDGDGFGVGFGCARPDCDDQRADVPDPNFCPGPEQPDAGVGDVGMRDLGTPDAGPGMTCGPRADVCQNDEICFMEMGCFRPCQRPQDCGSLHLGCLDSVGICICRVPCSGQGDCGPFECIDNCCQI